MPNYDNLVVAVVGALLLIGIVCVLVGLFVKADDEEDPPWPPRYP